LHISNLRQQRIYKGGFERDSKKRLLRRVVAIPANHRRKARKERLQ